MNQIEIEVKVLLQSEENAIKFLEALRAESDVTLTGKNFQLNHYFDGGDPSSLPDHFASILVPTDLGRLRNIVTTGTSFSIRTRQADERVIFVIKASIDETNSINGTGRIEFEVDVDMTIDELDKIILYTGYHYSSKWSRYREEYMYKDYTVCLDKNSGYGYVAEFERVVPDEKDLENIKREIRAEIQALGYEELSQDRVNRMYAYYLERWPEYYGASEFKYFDIP